MKAPLGFKNLLVRAQKAHGLEEAPADRVEIFWGEDFFHFDKSQVWRDLDKEKQRRVLRRLSEDILLDSFFIESAGMKYAGKQSLQGESLDEQVFFCLMAQEEAMHFAMLQPYFRALDRLDSPSNFSSVINHLIAQGTRNTNLFLIQILLEGWGLQHYRALVESGLSPKLNDIFTTILSDEARHHLGGILLFKNCSLSASETEFMKYSLKQLMDLVRAGPYTALSALLAETGESTNAGTAKLVNQMRGVEEADNKLYLLRRLIQQHLPENLFEFCEKNRLFIPFTAEEMAAIVCEGMRETVRLHQPMGSEVSL